MYVSISKYVDIVMTAFKVMFRNSSVVKIYIIRPKPGPVAKNVNSKAFRLGIEPVRFPARRPWSCIFRNWSRFGSYSMYPEDVYIYIYRLYTF